MLKFLLVAALACAIGFGIGYATGCRQRPADPALSIQSQMREVISSQHAMTVLSLNVLVALEKGDVEKAKSQLTRQIADYQHSWVEFDGVLPGHPKLLPVIQETVKHSPALQEELARRAH